MANTADVVIVTALEEERDAILRYLPRYRQQPPKESDIHIYYTAYVPVEFTNNTSGKYKVAVLSLVNMGRVQAATATTDAIYRWKPSYVLLVGIAGGVAAADVRVGDVIIADQVVDYELQKVTPKRASIRWDVHKADPRLLTAAKNLRVSAWTSLIKTSRPTTGAPKRHTGPIASGDKVIAVNEVLEQLRGTWPKMVGVEMEAGGAATAAFNSSDKPGFFMVRGVSDLADEKKGSASVEKWRAYACDVAAAFAIALLRSGPFPLQARATSRRNFGGSRTGRKAPKTDQGTASKPSQRGTTTIPLPPLQPEATQRDKDVFLAGSIKIVKQYFKKALNALKRNRPGIDFDLTPISPRKFIATIYLNGEVRNRCKIWLGDSFHSNSLCYIAGRSISVDQDNSINNWFVPEHTRGALYLKTFDYGPVSGGQPEGLYTPQQAAEYLWQRFIQPLMR